MSQTPNNNRDQPISYASIAAAAILKNAEGDKKKAPSPPSELEGSVPKPKTPVPWPRTSSSARAIFDDRQSSSLEMRALATQPGSTTETPTYDWQDLAGLSLIDQGPQSSRHSSESNGSSRVPRFSPSSGGSFARRNGYGRTPPSASSYGLHTPRTTSAVSPALHSGVSSNARNQFDRSDIWASSPQDRGSNKTGYPAVSRFPVNIGRFLVIYGCARASNAAGDLCHYIGNIGMLKSFVSFDSKSDSVGCILGGPVRITSADSKLVAGFFDIREAIKVYDFFNTNFITIQENVPIQCMPISKYELRQGMDSKVDFEDIIKESEAQIIIELIGRVAIPGATIQNKLEEFGELKTFSAGDEKGFIYKAEFFDSRAASLAIAELHGIPARGGRLKVIYDRLAIETPNYTLGSSVYNPGAFRAGPDGSDRIAPTAHRSDVFGNIGQTSHSRSSAGSRAFRPAPVQESQSFPVQDRFAPYNLEQDYVPATPPRLAAMGRRLDEPGMLQNLANQADISVRARVGEGCGGNPKNPSQAVPEHNRVFLQRIENGSDTRTTVMIKDIPLSREDLVKILNEVVPGEFDFVYLRFDFQNCCNVGYAFVNFTNLEALCYFIKARVGKKWNMYHSAKVLGISYAEFQGKQTLINRFRNSDVMKYPEIWHPQIFYTAGTKKGQLEPFPPSDKVFADRARAQCKQSAAHDPQEAQRQDVYRYEDEFDATASYDAHYGF